ncbi:hypothetical protein GW17_00029480, partial [Ensete ventricosum]
NKRDCSAVGSRERFDLEGQRPGFTSRDPSAAQDTSPPSVDEDLIHRRRRHRERQRTGFTSRDPSAAQDTSPPSVDEDLLVAGEGSSRTRAAPIGEAEGRGSREEPQVGRE